MTALGTSRVWVTLGYGILNEIYWPATGQPQEGSTRVDTGANRWVGCWRSDHDT